MTTRRNYLVSQHQGANLWPPLSPPETPRIPLLYTHIYNYMVPRDLSRAIKNERASRTAYDRSPVVDITGNSISVTRNWIKFLKLHFKATHTRALWR